VLLEGQETSVFLKRRYAQEVESSLWKRAHHLMIWLIMILRRKTFPMPSSQLEDRQRCIGLVVPTHYAVNAPWWTILGMANLDAGSSATVHLEAFSNTGDLAQVADKSIPAKGSILDHVKHIFGIGG